MALQYVGGTSGTGTTNGYAVSLNGTLTGGIASSPAAGDLVVVFTGFGNTASSAPAVSGNNSGAYSTATAAQHVNDTWDTEFASFYKIMGGTPDTSLSITRTANGAYGGGTTVQVWRGIHDTNPFIGAATPASGINTSAINPPAYNPAVTGALIIAGGAGTQATTGVAFTGFTGMSNFLSAYGDGTTSDTAVAMASFIYAGVSYDPPVASGGTVGNASSSWAGVTIAFRPQNYTLTAQNGSYSVTGQSAGINRGRVLAASAGSYSLSGQDAVITYVPVVSGYTLTAQAGSYAVAGQSASLAKGRVLIANNGSYSYSGQSATLLRSKLIAAQAGSYAYAGQSAILTYTPNANAYTLTALSGSYSLSGQSATLTRSRLLTAQAGSYALTGQSATLLRSRQLSVQSGNYSYTGSLAIIQYSGTPPAAADPNKGFMLSCGSLMNRK